MTTDSRKTLTAAILRLLRPLVRLLLRNGFSYGDFSDLAKWVFVDVASKEFGIKGRKQTVSRVSVITGLHRKEVARVSKIAAPDDEAISHQYNRAARVISGWLRDERFLTKAGKPASLAFDDDKSGFMALARTYSGDIPARAVLDELVRVDAVTRLANGRLRLATNAYVPKTGEENKLHILGTDVAFLLDTLDHNLREGEVDPRFQRKVAYDNLPENVIPEFRQLSEKKAQALLVELNQFLAQHDRDTNPTIKGEGRMQAGIGVYYFERDMNEDQ